MGYADVGVGLPSDVRYPTSEHQFRYVRKPLLLQLKVGDFSTIFTQKSIRKRATHRGYHEGYLVGLPCLRPYLYDRTPKPLLERRRRRSACLTTCMGSRATSSASRTTGTATRRTRRRASPCSTGRRTRGLVVRVLPARTTSETSRS